MEAEIQGLQVNVDRLESMIARQGRVIQDLQSELYQLRNDLSRAESEIRSLERSQRSGY